MFSRVLACSACAPALLLSSGEALAHHGSAISYDTAHLWTTWAIVTEFNYLNPHPSMTFDRTTKDGNVEHWVSELLTKTITDPTIYQEPWHSDTKIFALIPKENMSVGGWSGSSKTAAYPRMKRNSINSGMFAGGEK